ncbi:MAG TPA: hypothetical protein VK694_05410 [Verrucomicrobiae bacterium]|nr:hypothetical protein [Verrucomicrobiae bacterium]
MPIYEHQRQEWSERIQTGAEGLPLYQGGPGVDYSNAPNPVAVSVTMLHDPTWERNDLGMYTLRPETEALIAQRVGGHEQFSAITGYADRPDVHDPITFAALEEVEEEANMTEEDRSKLDIYLGVPFALPHKYEGPPDSKEVQDSKLDLLALIGVYTDPLKPTLKPNKSEVARFQWVALGDIKHTVDINPGYRDQTLPHALGALAASQEELSKILGVQPGPDWPAL